MFNDEFLKKYEMDNIVRGKDVVSFIYGNVFIFFKFVFLNCYLVLFEMDKKCFVLFLYIDKIGWLEISWSCIYNIWWKI